MQMRFQPGTEITDATSFFVAAAIGFAVVLTGFAAASRVRPIRTRTNRDRAMYAVSAGALGVVVGLANLLGNLAIASLDPRSNGSSWSASGHSHR